MADFENFKQALFCRGEPKRVPQFDGSVAEDHKARLLGKPMAGLAEEVAFCLAAGYDYVPLSIGFRQTIRGERLGIAGAKQQSTTLLRPHQARYNPFQQATSTRMWAEQHAGVIRDRASMDNFPWPDADRSYRYDVVEALGKLLPPEAKLVINVGYIFMAPWMLMGLESFCIALAREEPLVAQVIDRVGAVQARVVENLLDFDCVGAIRMPDDFGHTGGTIVAPRWLRKHIFPWHKRIGRPVRAKGLPYLLHSDGRLLDVIDDLIECGYHALHPCEPASMDIVALKRRVGGRLCLCGNIDLDTTLTRGTPEAVREEVKLRLRTVAPGGGYCCGASNSVPEYVPYENYLAMIEAIQQYGTYPIGRFY